MNKRIEEDRTPIKVKVHLKKKENNHAVIDIRSKTPMNFFQKIPHWIKLAGGLVGIITLLTFVWQVATYFYEEYRESHPRYTYETSTDWLKMEEAESILSNQSRVEVYKDHSEEGVFYNGAALTVLYNNLDEQERHITHFSVYAEDIVEDYSPNLFLNSTQSINPIGYNGYNAGWGETGEIRISVVDLVPAYGYEEQEVVELSLREGAITSWVFDSLKPGEHREFALLSEQDFIVEYKKPFDEVVMYSLCFEVEAAESENKEIATCTIEVHPDKLQVFVGGQGGPVDTNYVVWVDTALPTWSNTYKVHQVLPGKQGVRLPIFIVPKMSCTMSLRIEFETLDGEIITAEPLKNAQFVIPYYEDFGNYIDGDLLDWDNVDGNVVVYFPFESTSKVLPKGE